MSSSGANYSRIGQNLAQIRDSRAALAWVAVILVVQAVVFLAGGPYREPAGHWFGVLGLSRDGFLSGRIWSIASYWILHGNWFHAVSNGLLILLLGARVEFLTGPGGMTKTVVAGILGGGAMHLVLAPAGQGSPLLVGISGACLALLLLITTLSPDSRMMPLPVSGRSLGLGILTADLLLALMNPDFGVPGFSSLGKILVANGLGGWFTIGYACHLGGGLAGWAMGKWILRPRVSLDRLRADRKRREAE